LQIILTKKEGGQGDEMGQEEIKPQTIHERFSIGFGRAFIQFVNSHPNFRMQLFIELEGHFLPEAASAQLQAF